MLSAPIPPPSAPAWDALPGMVLLLGADGQARFANAALAAFAAQPAQALLGHGWRAILTEAARAEFDAVFECSGDFLVTLELRRGEGRTGCVECSARWLSDRSQCLCLLHDVTAGTLAQASVQAQAGLFRLLADNVPVLIAYYRAGDNVCQFANRLYAQAFGRDEQSILGLTVSEVIGDAAARQIQPYVDVVQRDGRPAQYERELRDAAGQPRWIEVNLLPHPGADGTTIGAFVLVADITKFRVAERAVRESEERLAKFMDASIEGIVFHRDGIIVDVNPPICALTGYPIEEMLGRRTIDFVAPDEVAKVLNAIASGQDIAYESAIVDKHGQRIPVEFIVRTMVRGGERLRMAIVRDIRDRRTAQARIHHLAHHDALTGLPNRMSFMAQIEAHLHGSRVAADVLALLFIDLDHFKRVNDSLGHLAGDTLLRTTAERIVGALRATDVVSRFGGDEFMVLLAGLGAGGQPRRHAEEVAAKLLHAIQAPLTAESWPISVTPSIGIAMFPEDGETPDELVKHADTAMYLAKSRGRANYQFFDRGMAGSAFAALVMEGELAQAFDRGEFELRFQPQVCASTGRVVGVEALIRWAHPERGLLLPDAFIPVAERQRLMLPIGQWVLREAIACASRWRTQGLPVPLVAVNLSTVQFQAAGFVDAVAAMLTPGAGALLELELTERMLMDDLPEVTKRLGRLQAMGVRISVDDFGTGYSSLGHLKVLPIDKVKIDRSFVHDLPHRADSAAIATAIIQMGKSLGLTVVAEGVETEAQRGFLADQGCDALQGLLVSPPLTLAQFEAWVEAGPRRFTSSPSPGAASPGS
jgi:diguanylate cyclase (GGDEF)-like protein/PAS domain S-box-containing protein